VFVHIIQIGVFDIQRRLGCADPGPGRLDPAGDVRDFGLGISDLFLAFLNLRLEIGHDGLPIEQLLFDIWM
jgi:hypothetical protein